MKNGQCDRLLPVCTACVETKAQCRPRSVPSGSTAEEAIGLSNAALPDYIETLKRKAEDLDNQSRRQRARLDTNDNAGTSQSPNTLTEAPQNSPQTSLATELTKHTSPTERSVQETMGEIGFLSRNAMAEPRDKTPGFPQELAIEGMIKLH
ncbi:hypothetical protein PHISCL_07304 [Aspergillus sclerotialis]|uniref:Zn(2)-C6 fungal-type domain-containing protein n=1 Tax=Aspergillus sclerotialis TaxID=2070753 RepID=A0A3A2ZR24_9EURO|nr:hypothetical protein PHISCL_07304 [Aspergillus sclerotialis]